MLFSSEPLGEFNSSVIFRVLLKPLVDQISHDR